LGPKPKIPPCSPFSPEAGNFGGAGAVCGAAVATVANMAIVEVKINILAKVKQSNECRFWATVQNRCSRGDGDVRYDGS
jgi:hypothetical protein